MHESKGQRFGILKLPPGPPKRACFRTLTFHTLHSTVYVALPVPKQLPYSGYATAHDLFQSILSDSLDHFATTEWTLWVHCMLSNPYFRERKGVVMSLHKLCHQSCSPRFGAQSECFYLSQEFHTFHLLVRSAFQGCV